MHGVQPPSSQSHTLWCHSVLPGRHALRSLLQVYALIEQQQQQPSSSLSAQELLRCVSTLAGLKYTQPLQLGAWLEAAATDKPAPVSSSTAAAAGVAASPAPSGTAAAGAAGAAGAGAAAAVAGSGSYRQVLAGLRMRELSALISNLARAGVRPSNVWLLAFMQVRVPACHSNRHAHSSCNWIGLLSPLNFVMSPSSRIRSSSPFVHCCVTACTPCSGRA
jgi:hypothetical protein